MKLFTKLIPIVALSCTTTIIVPIATSCQYSYGIWKGITIDVEDFVTNGYTRQIAALPSTTELSTDDGLQTYFDYIKKDPKIFADDLYDSISLGLQVLPDTPLLADDNADDSSETYIPVITEATGRMTVGSASVNTEESRLSFSINADMEMPVLEMLDLEVQATYQVKINATLQIKNLAVGMKYDTEPIFLYGKRYQMWNIYPDYFSSPYANDDKWSLQANGTIDTRNLGVDTHIDIDYKLTNKSDDGLLGYFTQIINTIDIPAMYFKNIVASDHIG